MAQCTARSKRTGERCKAQAVTGRTVCYHHGGKSKGGALSGTFQHGRRSRYLPENLLARYVAAQNDPKRLELADEIALTDTLIDARLENLPAYEDVSAWAELRNLIEQRRKLVESERKRLMELEQMIPADRAITLIASILDIIKRHVHDVGILAAIQEDFRILLVSTTGHSQPDIIDGDG